MKERIERFRKNERELWEQAKATAQKAIADESEFDDAIGGYVHTELTEALVDLIEEALIDWPQGEIPDWWSK